MPLLPRRAARRACSASAPSSSRPIAIRWRRTSRRPSPERWSCRRSSSAGSCAGCRRSCCATPPRVAAATPAARAALGYLHGNCAGCHNGSGPLADLDFSLEVRVAPAHAIAAAALATAIGHAARFQPAGAATQARIAPGAPERSLVALRMASRDAILQMPPLGTHRIDAEAVALVEDFIRELGRPVAEVTASRPIPLQ